MKKNLSFVTTYIMILFICLFNAITYAEEQMYQFVDLGVQESDSSEALCINDKNEIFGRYSLNGVVNFFIWNQENGMKLINFPKGAIPIKMNSRRQIIGYRWIRLGTEASERTYFVWDEIHGVIEIAANPNSGKHFVLRDINDNGQIIGAIYGQSQGAFIWENGQIRELDGLYGELGTSAIITQANSINNDGNIVGFSTKAFFHKGKIYRNQKLAVIWKFDEDLKISELLPYDDFDSMGQSINNEGHIVCNKSGPSGTFLFDLKQDKIILFRKIFKKGNYKRYLFSGCIDDSFVPIKIYELLPSGKAQLIDINLKITNLDAKIWKSTTVTGSNNSFWLIGSGRNVYGETHAILLTPE